ncbi:branched-chain amino acid ABC transporter permease [Magnetospirillum sp. 15-1]|uniref:branched-chain amino acid ABC transporter permease n=1 Tax=Magnetospirillum sp. 15-1 TaxID=1979370 RepID=UPI000BBC07A2|nr:branched-chain amino acid ABC transporter permease [Magnetospirillum sp. 15-1]
MQYFVDQVISGIAVGAIYGLVAMGFSVIYKATGLLNFAQGEMSMVTAYVAWSLASLVPGNVWLVAGGSLAASLLLGLVIERVVMRPMLGEPVFATVMVTIALSVILRSVIQLIWDPYPHALDLGVGRDVVQIGQTGIRTGQIAVMATLLAVTGGVWLFFRYSRVGKAMRAVASDERAAQLMGISAARIHAVAWMGSSMIAGIAGVFFALIYNVSPSLYHVGLKAFPATILGGLDSVLGSGFSGVFLGVAENLAGGYLAPTMKEIIGFVIIIAVLMIRPFGLFGQRDIERV